MAAENLALHHMNKLDLKIFSYIYIYIYVQAETYLKIYGI